MLCTLNFIWLLRQNFKPIAVGVFDEINSHFVIFKADASHFLVLFVCLVKVRDMITVQEKYSLIYFIKNKILKFSLPNIFIIILH